MANSELLSRDEIDALLHEVEDGVLENAGVHDGVARAYDLASRDCIMRERMPALDGINEHFARLLRNSFFSLLRRRVKISVGDVQRMEYSEYMHSLSEPASLNLIKIHPLRGKALCVIDPALVFMTVDYYFGGTGRYAGMEGRDFSPMENRVIQIVLDQACKDLQEAWAPVLSAEVECTSAESDPQFANIASPTDAVVVSSFHLELDNGGGSINVVMPCTMLEPVLELLAAGDQCAEVARDERWSIELFQEVKAAEVKLSCTLANARVRLSDLLKLKQGDVIPINYPQTVTLVADDVPVLRGVYGMRNGNKAVKVTEMIKRSTASRENVPLVAAGVEK